MKKIISLLTVFSLLFSFAITASAANISISISGNGSVTLGNNVTYTVNLSGAQNCSGGSIALTVGDKLEVISGEFIKNEAPLNYFDLSKNKGALSFGKDVDLNGAFFRFTVKAKEDSSLDQQISVNVTLADNSSSSATKTLKITSVSHSFGSYIKVNDTTHKRVCSECGYEEITNHTWNSGKVTKQANCKETGVKHFECSACKAEKDETIAKTNNHSWGNYEVKVKPGCTTQGTQIRECSVCKKTETHSIPATGHSFIDWKTSKAAGCTTQGEEKRSCSKCGHTETRATNALGHSFSNPTVTKKPTCTESGIESGKCTRCGQTTSQSIKPLGHKFSEWSDTKAPDCTNGGMQERKCTVCGAAETRNTPALGHDFENPTVIKEPTISETGLKEGKCKRCGQTTSEVIPCSVKDETTGTLFEANEGTFEKGSEIKVEEIKKEDPAYESVKNILKDICKEFKLYDITAYLNGAKIQPKNEVTVTFKIPEGFGKNIAIYYITEDGNYEKLESTVNEAENTISAKLSHFSNYAICKFDEKETKSADIKDSKAKDSNHIWIFIVIAIVLIAGAGVGGFFIFKKKKAKIS